MSKAYTSEPATSKPTTERNLLEKMSDEELMKAEKALIMDDPLRLVDGGYLTIMTKGGELRRLELNYVQKRLLKRVMELIGLGKPVRIWTLKARQTGISTLIQAMCYAMTSQREAVNSMVLAHDIDGSNYLFGMQKLYQETVDEHLRPIIKHSNEKKLEFDKIHSQILIETSDNLKAGRAVTLRFVHMSEVSRFRDLRTLMLSINQSVPNLPGTFIIGETTANGMNQFYDEWQAVKAASAEGLTDWETFFIPWFEVPEYSMGGAMYPIDAIEFVTASDKENFLIEERVIKEKYSLTDEQINWRRWCIVNNCNRSLSQFNQEYPDSEETAFVATGDNFFDKTSLARQEAVKPKSVGNIVKENGKYIWRESGSGLFKIYEMPMRGEQYVIAGDPAEGLEHGDKSASVVLNKKTNRTACVYNHNIPPDRFEEDLIKLGYFYNEALIACESKGYGYSVNQGLYKNYGRVYRKITTRKGYTEQKQDLGWNTNSVSRPSMLAQLAEEILNGSTDLLDKDLINQAWTFINNVKRGQPEAEKGKADDLIMARCYDDKTRVLTNDGWKYFKDVKKGDLIPSLDIKTNKVELVKNIETIISDYKGDMIHFDSRGVDLLVTPNHRMVVSMSRGANKYENFCFVDADKLVGKHFRLKKDGIWEGTKLNQWEIPSFNKHNKTKILKRDDKGRILLCDGHQYSRATRKLPIKEFLQFLGFYIAEGSGDKNRLSLAQMSYSKGWNPIKECLSELGINYKELKDRFVVQDTQFSSYIKELVPGFCYEKRIPREILDLSPDLLIYLYDFMMLGDGCDNKVYITTSEGLKDDFLELINKLGWSGNYKCYDKIGMGGFIRGRKITAKHLCYVISINRKHLNPRINHHKGGRFGTCYNEDYNGKIYCLNLEKNNTLLVERNGRTCWSGNSIAGMVRNEQPYKDTFRPTKKVRRYKGLSGY